ncbi:MAG: aminotransferase class I/II-fold pyridoxal phosphate-dependent enzyme [Gammaproteobacteria bacterium]|nr:aminotransferase class I/II-fold pyridoxal phosphate-dependent enzyme [Gammaproteobacteria bacterium]
MGKLKYTYNINTLMNHFNEHDHPLHSHTMPIFQTSSFGFTDMDEAVKTFSGEDQEHFVYTRGRNPNILHLAKKIALLEGIDLIRAEPDKTPDEIVTGHCTASGMAALNALVLSLLKSGDHILTHTSLYSGSHLFLTHICPNFGINVTVLDSNDPDIWEEALIKDPKIKLLYLESPSNPRIDLYDIELLANLAHQYDAKMAVDNTSATPYHQRPLTLGSDFVIHSSTKFLSGHGVTTGGAIVGRDVEFISFWGKLGQTAMELGATPSPTDCWLANNGLKTFSLRMERHSSNAMKLATYLEGHHKTGEVLYPGLESNQHHLLAKRQMTNGFGCLISFEVGNSKEKAHQFIDALTIPSIAISFGSTDSVIQLPASMTHSGLSPEERRKAKIADSLIRIAVGIENIDDILLDIEQALNQL